MKLFSNYITSLDKLEEQFVSNKQDIITEATKVKREINIKNVLYISSKGDLGKSELKIFKQAMKKYPDLKVTYIFNFFTYNLDKDDNIVINYIDEDDSTKELSYTLNLNDNLSTLIIYKSIHPKFWNEYMYDFSELLKRNFFLQINPPCLSQIANDKYKSYELLKKYNLPQPKTCLIEKSDIDMFSTDEAVYTGGKLTLINKLGKLYNIQAKTFDDLKEYEFVVKTLSGSHGIGVFLCNGGQILGILQTAFALDENLKLLVQVKEKTIDGDLRVHVLTLSNGQFILAKMKRKKIKSDFRSNYSLGADIEEVELNEQQISIAKDVARVSGLTWCAVDIMPIKKNEYGQENVIIEYNQNPGVEGISKVMGKNFFNIMLDTLFDNLTKYDFYNQYTGKNNVI